VTDAIPSDHPAVDAHRVELTSVGSTGRPQLVLPTAVTCTEGEFVRLVVDGRKAHAEVVSTLGGGRAIRTARANKQLARKNSGDDLLGEWLDDAGFGPGSTLVLDVLTEGYAYGLRAPGERVVYEPIEKPDSSLSDIADSLDE
jgi:hypothetical protein